MLWIGIITYGVVMSAGSRHAAIAATTPPAACFLLAPLFAMANGDPALFGWLTVFSAMLSIASTLTVLGLSNQLFESQQRGRLLEEALYTDSETGLPTRALLKRAGQEAKSRGDGFTFAVLSLDGKAHLRGVLGFEQFAQLTVQAAKCLGEIHDGPVCLISIDTLGLLIPETDATCAVAYAERLRARFETPLSLGGIAIDVSPVMGLAPMTENHASLRHATIAVEQAKAAHQPVAMFDPTAYGDPSGNLALMSRMLNALQNGDMTLHYQPKLHLRSGKVLAAEALCRWNDSKCGAIPVDAFIAMAEETGHIRALTEWVVGRVIEDQRRLEAQGHRITLAVNISGALLGDPQFARWALETVAPCEGKIVFEVTETAVINDPERALKNVAAWAEAGIPIAIDDYGSGLSSLAYLKSLPAKELKLDRSLVGDVANSGKDALLVKSTIDLAHGLGLEVTAEGVETPAALAALKLVGCDWAQGYLLSRPLNLHAFAAFLESFASGEGGVLAEGLQDLNRQRLA